MNFGIRTDLAIETREMYKKAQKIDDEIPGVETQVDNSDPDILITRVKVTTKEAEEAMGKPLGTYITFEVPKLKNQDDTLNEKVSKKVSEEIKSVAKLVPKDTVLVVGLGNWNVTADALRTESNIKPRNNKTLT